MCCLFTYKCEKTISLLSTPTFNNILSNLTTNVVQTIEYIITFFSNETTIPTRCSRSLDNIFTTVSQTKILDVLILLWSCCRLPLHLWILCHINMYLWYLFANKQFLSTHPNSPCFPWAFHPYTLDRIAFIWLAHLHHWDTRKLLRWATSLYKHCAQLPFTYKDLRRKVKY